MFFFSPKVFFFSSKAFRLKSFFSPMVSVFFFSCKGFSFFQMVLTQTKGSQGFFLLNNVFFSFFLKKKNKRFSAKFKGSF